MTTRLTQLIDPASSYETMISSGVKSVRAKPANPATAVVGVTRDGTTWAVNQEGDVRTEAHDAELLIPKAIITPRIYSMVAAYFCRIGKLPVIRQNLLVLVFYERTL